jgi:hypothetical protein
VVDGLWRIKRDVIEARLDPNSVTALSRLMAAVKVAEQVRW